MIYNEIDKRKEARILAEQAITEGNPLDWFEILYSKSENTEAIIPWADMAPNPNVVDFFERNGMDYSILSWNLIRYRCCHPI